MNLTERASGDPRRLDLWDYPGSGEGKELGQSDDRESMIVHRQVGGRDERTKETN